MGGIVKSVGKFLFGESPKVVTSVSPFAGRTVSIFDSLSSTYNQDYFKNNTLFGVGDLRNLANLITSNFNSTITPYLSGIDEVIANYKNIYNEAGNIEQLVQNAINKSNTSLAFAGLLNTPANQRTISDIVSKLNFDKLGLQNQINTNLAEAIFKSQPAKMNSILNYVNSLTGLNDIALHNALLPFETQYKIAMGYSGIPVNTVVKPGTSGLIPSLFGGASQAFGSVLGSKAASFFV